MVPLSDRARELVTLLFDPGDRPDAERRLAEDCADRLPLVHGRTPAEFDRLRFAALRFSGGHLPRLHEALRLAAVDWRDLLVAGGFADDLAAHDGWYAWVRKRAARAADREAFPRAFRLFQDGLRAAIVEAEQGAKEGGIPVGSVLVHGDRIIGRGHNRRIQRGSAILHGEMDALEDAGRQAASVYRECTLFTTLSPCAMCSGAILLYGIPSVVVGENQTFRGEEELLRSRGVSVEVLQDEICIQLMARFIRASPALWNEDIGR